MQTTWKTHGRHCINGTIVAATPTQFSTFPRAALLCPLESHNDSAGRTGLLVLSQAILAAVTKHYRLGGL